MKRILLITLLLLGISSYAQAKWLEAYVLPADGVPDPVYFEVFDGDDYSDHIEGVREYETGGISYIHFIYYLGSRKSSQTIKVRACIDDANCSEWTEWSTKRCQCEGE